MHVGVAKLCIQHKKALVTASYVSPAMAALHDSQVFRFRSGAVDSAYPLSIRRAKDAGVVLLNELGLVSLARMHRQITTEHPCLQDPGIDHITAMRLIHEAKETGNKVSASSSPIRPS